jgi:excisionase family DNA binding protein
MADQEPSSEDRFLAVTQVATIMNLSPMDVYRLVHYGVLESIREGRHYLVSEKSVRRYLEA